MDIVARITNTLNAPFFPRQHDDLLKDARQEIANLRAKVQKHEATQTNLRKIATYLKGMQPCHACVVEGQQHECMNINAKWAGREILRTLDRDRWNSSDLKDTVAGNAVEKRVLHFLCAQLVGHSLTIVRPGEGRLTGFSVGKYRSIAIVDLFRIMVPPPDLSGLKAGDQVRLFDGKTATITEISPDGDTIKGTVKTDMLLEYAWRSDGSFNVSGEIVPSLHIESVIPR